MNRQLITSGAKWEAKVGYSRAVRVGRHVIVSGTTAVDVRGRAVGGEDVRVRRGDEQDRLSLGCCVGLFSHSTSLVGSRFAVAINHHNLQID